MSKETKITLFNIIKVILFCMLGIIFSTITTVLLYYPIRRKTKKYVTVPTFEERNYILLK